MNFPHGFSLIAIHPLRLLALGLITLIAVTWPLWTGTAEFPQIPLFTIFVQCPLIVDWLCLAVVLYDCGGLVIGSLDEALTTRRCLRIGLAMLLLCLLDQHRLQPWAWEYLAVGIVVGCLGVSRGLNFWRWLIISIYIYSAISKMNELFARNIGKMFLDTGLRLIGQSRGVESWSPAMIESVARGIPQAELVTAVLLLFWFTRPLGILLSTAMHLTLIAILGPWGLNHSWGVLTWNIVFAVQVWNLFAVPRLSIWSLEGHPSEIIQPAAPSRFSGVKSSLSWITVVFVLVFPMFQVIGKCDAWLGWAVYTGRDPYAIAYLSREQFGHLPKSAQPLDTNPQDDQSLVRLNFSKWSLRATGTPLYPSERYLTGVILATEMQYGAEFDSVETTVPIGPENHNMSASEVSRAKRDGSYWWFNTRARFTTTWPEQPQRDTGDERQ